MNNKVELKVNVINQLKLFQYSTFKDRLCFLDENIQNAQRAGAKNVYIKVNEYDKELIIENDGQVLEDPQKLFSIAESGWNKETTEEEKPFGIGFFSNVAVSSFIEIYTGDKKIIFDVNKMIKNNNPELEILHNYEYYNGFKIILKDFNFDDIYNFLIEERVVTIGQYTQDIEVYYNKHKINKKNLLEGDDSVFQIICDEKDYKGYLSICSYSGEIKIFHKGRYVTSLHNLPYVNGNIHINNKILDLTAPDRKNIVKNDLYYKFKKEINIMINIMCEDALLNGKDKDIKRYLNAIKYYIDVNKIKTKMKFLTFKNDNEIKYLKQIALCKRKKSNEIKSFEDYKIYITKKDQEESNLEEVCIETIALNETPEARGIYTIPSNFSYIDEQVIKPNIDKTQQEEKEGEIIFNLSEPIFWMTFDELEKFEYRLNIIKHYNLKLIISRNSIENMILKNLEENNIYHISQLKEKIILNGVLSNTKLNIKEQRALMLFDLISRTLNFNHNIFSIGNLMVTKTISIPSLNLTEEIIESNVVVLKHNTEDKIYVDRSIIDVSDLQETLDQIITLEDYKFILNNLYTIAKQVELLKGTTSQKIVEEIILKLGKGELL